MAHIHTGQNECDFVNAMFVVHPSSPKILLIKHKLLGAWLPVGGHNELTESPDEALKRELLEESGLVVGVTAEVMQSANDRARRDVFWPRDIQNSPDPSGTSRQQWMPYAIDIHNFKSGDPLNHRHIALVYVVRAWSDIVDLEDAAHDAIEWVHVGELADVNSKRVIWASIRHYGLSAWQWVNKAYPGAYRNARCSPYA